MRTRTEWLGAAVATLTLGVLVLLDVAQRDAAVALSPLFALAPLIAAAVLPGRVTALFAAAAVLLAVAAGWWNGDADTTQHWVRVVDVLLMGAAAVAVAAFRVYRERQVLRLTTIAEVAQRAVLPVLPAHARRTDIAVRYQSAARDAVMGGDLYDCYHSRSHTRFLLGDVRGKGIEAIEQAARVIRAFRQAAAVQRELGVVAEDMSGYLMPFFDEEEFVTAVLIDTTEAGRASLVNAGHPPPLLVRADGTCEFIEVPADLPLGLGVSFERHEFTWEPGDRLLLYTDGVSEARDARGEFLDLRSVAPLLVGGTVDDALDRLLGGVRAHAVGGELNDDVAVLLLEHTAAGDEYLPQAGEHDWRTSLQR
ncbi:PP2C family protein-serine/threonine phosphatase [Nocardioides campestrisoli]|uniref:PP2C family protein-serine/threonine phosphatase n=1 Tax=Nocardioides campestrisoli TaxID=2736757 RepID=UPI0015E7B023|nr:PP2C family protein-serine/threonine phosphatase [Nocardioides campestrisoli]